ncbi:hypothetical protein VTH8203_00843 [Vibrio thalassae]|uniref:Integrative conjugative element protein, RAQPRD family n=1 Tax=Vibrio thalassae TaxID=1243014 RepID=A0A240EEX9_9VIBR|nr:RAQPRD family integrative conjugative element protein [Vibrio thalassae]SNX47242.1 hypothetical protein VTH8203_00843 [Vibrio thalassae]
MMKQIVPILTLIFAASPQASVWEERELLERYITQLEILNKTLLVDAQDAADPHHRIKLNYQGVQRDANEIVNKLRHHLNTPLEEYRSLTTSINTEEVNTQ